MGDPEREGEFHSFVVERSAALLRLAYLLTADRAAAEDLLQMALVRSYVRWRRISDPEAYVRRVLVGVASDERRRAHRRHEVSTAELPEVPSTEIPADRLDVREALRGALATLPSRQRAAVVLRYWVGLEVTEVADLLGCTAGTVRSQTARGLDKLREAYTSSSDAPSGQKGAERP